MSEVPLYLSLVRQANTKAPRSNELIALYVTL